VQTTPDTTTRLGGWLFRHRTSLPIPIAIVILVVPAGPSSHAPLVVWSGVAVTLIGEAIRLWGVHHIGVISRTRSERLGPLIDTGPFARVRNPLYVGNTLLWIGLALTAGLAWFAPIVLVALGAEYHAIVRWEEQLLESRLGETYRDYAARVPRWIPRTFADHDDQRGNDDQRRDRRTRGEENASAYSWRATLFSERGTLVAIFAGYVLLWLKVRS
jgi:protein-S-isoprenylcysteine O-methyltransferase Ste14